MDEKTAVLLKEWGFGDYIPRFADIMNDIFKGELDPMIRFELKLCQYIHGFVQDNSDYFEPDAPFKHEDNWTETNDPPPLATNPFTIKSECDLNLDLDSVNEMNILNPEEDRNITALKPEMADPRGASQAFSNTQQQTEDSVKEGVKRTTELGTQLFVKRICRDEENQELSAGMNPYCSTENIVEMYLMQNVIGQAVLKSGKGGKLTTSLRAKLCHQIVVCEMGSDPTKCITKVRFQQLTDCILKLFPEEVRETYFIPRIPAQGRQPPILPKGILYDKYHNLLKFLREHRLRHKDTAPKFVMDNDQPTDIATENGFPCETSIQRDIKWLECYSGMSPSFIILRWKRTAEHRMEILRNLEDCIAKSKLETSKALTYFQRFPCLSLNWGLNLLLQDFEYLFKGKHKPLIPNWQETLNKLISLSNEKCSDFQTGDIVKCLSLVPGLFNQPILASGYGHSRKTWKPNYIQSCQGFILYLKDISLLKVQIERIGRQCQEVHKSLQPIPVLIGPSETEIVECFVLMDYRQFPMLNPLVAVDTCFKLYHALHLHYPFQASYAWLFFQQAVYGIFTKWDPVVPAVSSKVSEFNRINSLLS